MYIIKERDHQNARKKHSHCKSSKYLHTIILIKKVSDISIQSCEKTCFHSPQRS